MMKDEIGTDESASYTETLGMNPMRIWSMAAVAMLALLKMGATSEPLPDRPKPLLGSPDFYPSPERPVGWRGDGTGAWPGATPVTKWDAATGENIVWKTPMPAIGWSQPVIVGEKVFVNADPNILLCVSALDGKILWQREVDHTTLMKPDDAKFVKGEIEYFNKLWDVYVQWRLDLEQFYADATAKSVDLKPLKGGKRGEKLSGEGSSLEPGLKARYDALFKLQEENGFVEKLTTGNGELISCRGPIKERWGKLVKDYDVWFYNAWQTECSDTMASPVSDGRFVYVAMANCQTACYDLNGALKWMVWDHPQGKGNELNFLGTRFVPSPLLVGNAVVVNNNGEVRAYDKTTGKKLWGVVCPYSKPGDTMRQCRPFPEAVSPIAFKLQLNGKPFLVVTDGGGNIYRLSDGKIVGKGLPSSQKGATPIALGDLYIWETGADGGSMPHGVCRLKAVSEDVVEFSELWRVQKNNACETTDVYHDGWIYDGKGARFELMTGREEKCPEVMYGYCSPAVGGEFLMGISRSQGPDKVAAPAKVVSTKTLGQVWSGPNGIVDRRRLDDPAFRRRWRFVLNPTHGDLLGSSSPAFAGNRMFFRSGGYLWCIGDPKQPFPTPKACPPDARAK